jgi:ABC-type amino acid transport substrate-binding protein/nitrogen-specific signal transduction histidine kinase/PAS domain-containing protein
MRKHIFELLLTICIMTVFSTQSAGKKTSSNTLPDTVHILGDQFYPPYEFYNTQGVPEGFTIDLIKEVMHRLNIPYTIKLTSRSNMMKTLKEGKVNLYLGMTYTEARAKHVKYGTILDYVFKCAVFRKDKEYINSFLQLRGKRVAVEKGTYAYDLIKLAGYKAYAVDNLKDAFILLNKNKCDAVMCNKETVEYMVDKFNYKNLDFYILEFQPEKFCLTGNNEHLLTKINLTIYDLKKDGTYNRLVNKWFVKESKVQNMRIFYTSITIILAICLVLIFFNTILRYKVRKATARLENESKRLSLSVHAGNIRVWGYDVIKNKFFNIHCDYFPPEGQNYENEIQYYHPDDINILRQAFKNACKGYATEKPIRARMDRTLLGNWRYIDNEMISVKDAKGNIIRIIGTHKDVTEEVKRIKQMEELFRQYSVLFNNSSIGTQLYDKNGKLISINNAACTIFGINDKERFLQSNVNIYDNPDLKKYLDRNNPQTSYHIIEVNFDEHKKSPYFKENTTLSGIHFIETHITAVFDNERNIDCIIVNNIDITERRRLQMKVEEYTKRMNYILKSSGIIIWDYDVDTQTMISRIARDNEVEETEWRNILSYVDSCDKKKIEKTIEKMNNRELGDCTIQIKLSHTNRSKESQYFTFHGTPVKDKNGFIKSYSGVSVNVTSLIQAQLQLQQEKEQAQRADKLKSAFLANMSHEIRTPLNSIVGFSEMMPFIDTDDERNNVLNIIKSNNKLLLRLINDVLDLSRIESGNMEIIDKRFNIEEMFASIYESFQPLMPNENVKLICITPQKNCFITADRNRLTQVITNFINNAKKFTVKGHIKIGYKYLPNGIYMYVEDTGKGIPKDKTDEIFERFEKLDPFMQGTGLGLSICKAIVHLYNGKIGVESEEGKGSTFWILLPFEYNVDEGNPAIQ